MVGPGPMPCGAPKPDAVAVVCFTSGEGSGLDLLQCEMLLPHTGVWMANPFPCGTPEGGATGT